MNPIDDAKERAEQHDKAESETEVLRKKDNGKFYIAEDDVVDFARKDLSYNANSDKMGKGTFSEMVYRGTFKPPGRDQTIPVAIKSMQIFDRQSGRNEQRGIDDRSKEVLSLRKVTKHENVVTLYGFVYEDNCFYMCMELMDASLDEVRKVIYDSPNKRLPKQKIESFLGCVTVSVVDALSFFRKKVIHRDLKPANIMLNERGEIKLCDFGVSKKLQTAVSVTRATTGNMGTNIYMAPERFNAKLGEAKGYGSKSEVWSLGITLIVLATGIHPYGNKFDARENIENEKEEPPKINDTEYSTRLRNFVNAWRVDCLFKTESMRSSVLPIATEDNKDADPRETNNVQSKNFYTFHAKRTDRNECVKEILEHSRDGLPAIRAKLD